MNYSQAIARLNGFIDFERLPEPRFSTTPEDIDRFRTLLEELGAPHRRYSVIHIVGTKGKGSTAAMLTAVLRAAGYRVGLYTSPHLISVRERIRLNGRMVSKVDFAKLISRTLATADSRPDSGQLAFRTVFEHLTAAALLYYARQRADIVVVEAGLGARLDATIVLDPALSIITPIGLDHTQVLGDKISKIAADKSHAIKPGVVAVTAPQTPEAMRELTGRAKEVGSHLVTAPGRDEFEVKELSLRGTRCRAAQRNWIKSNLQVRLPGRFQLDNASVVLSALELLRNRGWRIPDDAVGEGLRSVLWFGRLHYLSDKFGVVLDGSHNALSMKAVCDALAELAPDTRWQVVFSALMSKPVLEMMEILAPLTAEFQLAPIRFPKAAPVEQLVAAVESVNVPFRVYRSVPRAYEGALSRCRIGHRALVTGSFYLVGEVMRHRRGLKPPPVGGKIDADI
jgi:dihydrofolate synthase/folylpolyglutamate synthase